MEPKPTYNEEERLTVGVSASILGVHPQTLRNYEAAGYIAATRTPGGKRRFRRGDVEQLRDNPPQLYKRTPRDVEDVA